MPYFYKVQVLIVLLVIHAIVVLAFQQMPQVQQQMLHHLVALNVEFSEQYRVAKEMYAHCIFDEIQHIADTCDPTEVQKAKLMIDARKYIASRLAPKKYGEASLIDAPTEEEQKDREIMITRRIVEAQLSDLFDELGDKKI